MIDLQALAREARELEPMPASATRLAALLAEEDWRLSDIVEVVELDQALTGRLLSLANSVASGSRHPTTSVSQAVMRNGPGMVLSLSMAPVVRQQFHGPLSTYGLHEGELWRHSVAAALVVRQSVGLCRTPPPPPGFAAALLHDVGKLVLDRHLQAMSPAEGSPESAGSGTGPGTEAEGLGIDHGKLGGIIAADWKLPAGIGSAIRFHHRPAEAPDEEGRVLASFVALADAVTYHIGAGGGEGQPKLPPDVVRRIGITREGVAELCKAAANQLEKTLAIFS